jgi:hypothetical protein
MVLPSSSGETYAVGSGRSSLMSREEPSLETLWLQNIRTMDKVQIIDRNNRAPSSKTFRDELLVFRTGTPEISAPKVEYVIT